MSQISAPVTRRARLRSLYVRWLPLALGATAVVNIALSAFLGPSALPIRPHDDGSLTELVHTEQPSLDRRFGFYLELDDATDPGTLFVSEENTVIAELADGFAELEVVVADFDPTLPPGIEPPEPLGVLETDDGDIPYSIIRGDGNVWWIADAGNAIVVVPATVVPVPEAMG